MIPVDYSGYYWQNELVRLRPCVEADWEEFYRNRFDSPARFLLDSEVELPATEDGAREMWREFLEQSHRCGRINFTIETLDGTSVGSANLNGIDERNGVFGIGMQIHRGCRGKGYGTAAMRILLDYAFRERRLHKFQGYVMEGNTASATMLRKLGCVQEGVRRGTVYHQGRYWDEIHFGLFAEEFSASNPIQARHTII